MRRNARLSLTLAAGLSMFGLVGCTVTAPTTAFAHAPDGGSTEPNEPPTQNEPDMSGPQVVHPPVLGDYPHISAWSSVPLHGKTDPNVTVLISSASGESLNTTADSSGNFCVDAKLVAGQVNTFTLEAVNANGVHSNQITASVSQEGTPPTQQPPSSTTQNLAMQGTASAYQIGADGQADATPIIDGDTTTDYEEQYDTTWFGTNPMPYFEVTLASSSTINQIVAIAPADCPFGELPQIYYSNQAAPAAPGPSVTGWTALNGTMSADNLTYTASFGGLPMQSIAVMWAAPTRSSIFSAWVGGCGTQNNGTYGLAELQALSEPGASQPTPVAPTCGGGG